MSQSASAPNTDTGPPLDPLRAGGLFSERQIVLPLTIAILITLPLSLTLLHFLDPARLPGGLARYLGNQYCQLMIGVFTAVTLYAGLQYLGLLGDRRQLRQQVGAHHPPRASRLQDWIAFLTGRRHQDSALIPAALRRWSRQARSREDFVQLSDYVLMLRAQQHQHNFAPIGFAIWVLPLLGFIGTVIGITAAIGGLEQSVTPSEMDGRGLGGVLGGLKFAFDTTFIGLVLVIPTMLYLLTLRTRAQTLDMLYYQMLLDRHFQETAD